MRKLTKILLLAIMAVPFLQACNSTYEQADKVALVTVQKSLDPAGFYGILDSGEKLYPGVMRVIYTPSNDLQRAIIYFSELEEPREGYAYNADVFNVAEVTTEKVTKVWTAEADTLVNGLEITNAWIGGGFLNVEFKVNIDAYGTKLLTVGLQDMLIDGPVNTDDGYYPFTLGVKRYPEVDTGMAETTITSMACFYLGSEYNLSQLGCNGYKISYKDISEFEDETKTTIVVPENTQSSYNLQ